MTDDTTQAAKAQAMIIPVTPFQQNCTLLWCTDTNIGTVIDPGGDVLEILNAVRKAKVDVKHIWLTHGHVDHVGGAAQLRDELKVPITGPHLADKFLLDHVVESGGRFGISGLRNVTPDQWLSEGDTVSVGNLNFSIYHCPGHSPGSVVFFNDAMRFAIMGDVLFNGSIGRTDMPGGDHETLLASIRDKVLPLGDDVGFICGHGPGSNIGHERRTNPFLNGMA